MALGKRHSNITFITKFLWILFLVFQESNLVICDGFEDDSLKTALEAVERRQRDLEFQENDYYGQPENIGYGFQKTIGFFDNGQAAELGSFDSNPKNEANFQNYLLNYGDYLKDGIGYDEGFDKQKSNFRERLFTPRNYLIDRKDSSDYFPQSNLEYLQMLKNLRSKYLETHPEEVNIEDLTDDQVEEILRLLQEEGGADERFGNDYPEPNERDSFEMIPVRSRKNYRVFDKFGDRRKRYPSFGEGIYGKRNFYPQSINYENPSENEFLYSLKYVNPERNRDAVENLREEGMEVLGDEKDKDVIRILSDALSRSKPVEEDEPYWLRDQNSYDETWLPGRVVFSENGYEGSERNEKRGEISPKYFKNHNGIHLNVKRFPVKRSSTRVRKEAKNEKVSKELKGIFATPEATTIPPKKTSTKKPTEIIKKQNATKPETTKYRGESKKVVRRADGFTKEVLPVSRNEEIIDIFKGGQKSKKSIDWSQYFGLDKRSEENWLKEQSLRRAEAHLMGPKRKRYSFERPRPGTSADARKVTKKSFPFDIGANIDRVEDRIGDIEEKVIDDAIKYTGAHSGGGKENSSQVKNKVIQRLEAAYSLEKMRNALEEFKSLIKPYESGEPSKKSATEPPKAEARTTVPKESPNLEKPLSDKRPDGQAKKRVAVKKEGVKKMFSPETSDSVEFLNDVYGNKQYENEECPVLDRILHNCLRVEEMGGRYAEVLVSLCSLQQICYFCGPEIGFPKASMCDAIYLTEAQNVCQGDNDCLVNARNSMLALQDLYELELMSEDGRRLYSDSCLANSCIQKYFLNAPGAFYPLEIQK